jgi:hypothetical protein
MRNSQLIVLLLLAGSLLNAQEKFTSILFQNGVIHTADGVIENGVLGIRGDSIVLIADARVVRIDASAFEKTIQLNGKHIFPGFIALNSSVGLKEIDAVRATLDHAEVGILNPHVRSLTAFNTDSRIIPTLRANGILTVQACPQQGLVSGHSSVFRLNGWNWEDAVRYADDGLHVSWPSAPMHLNLSDTSSRNASRSLKQIAMLQELFRDAQAYASVSNAVQKNLRLEAMRGLFSGKEALFLHAENARDISDAVLFAASFKIPRIVLVGGNESGEVIPLLKSHHVAVVLSRLHRLPDLPDSTPQEIFSLPAKLYKAGITVALSYDGDMETMGTRNLGFIAGTAAAYGLSLPEALELITLNPARILGIDSKEGSLETGKKACFFISEGNALDMMYSTVSQVYIDGVEVDIDTEQKELYRKYMKKYGLN